MEFPFGKSYKREVEEGTHGTTETTTACAHTGYGRHKWMINSLTKLKKIEWTFCLVFISKQAKHYISIDILVIYL